MDSSFVSLKWYNRGPAMAISTLPQHLSGPVPMTQVNPVTAWFENSRDRFDVLDDVVRCEARVSARGTLEQPFQGPNNQYR